jgi:hypothetical protein
VLKEEAKERVGTLIDQLTLSELTDRFWEGRRQYGGEFDIEAIPVKHELFCEAEDVVLYTLFLLLQREE